MSECSMASENGREEWNMVEGNKSRSPSFQWTPWNFQCLWKKTLIEDKNISL